MAEYKVPKLLWESLESVLLAQSRKYIAELAKRLSVPEKELLKQVLPSADSLKVYIQDSSAQTNQCKAYVQRGKITSFCRRPNALGCEFCAYHKNKRMLVIREAQPENLQKIRDTSDLPPLWINPKGELINSNVEKVGTVDKSTRVIKIFRFVD